MWLKDLFDEGRRALEGEYPSARERDALLDVLLGDVLHLQQYARFTDPFLEIGEGDCGAFLSAVRRLSEGEPLQYVTGWAEFYGRRFNVCPSVLIPRPETEELCRMVIEKVRGGASQRGNSKSGASLSKGDSAHLGPDERRVTSSAGPRILDLCTGSGCIAWTLALELPGSAVWGVDISEDALEVAAGQPFGGSGDGDTGNGVVHFGAASSVAPHFVKYDVLGGPDVFPEDGFDAIVSNPPYVRESERPLMRRNVLEHEPSLALFVPDENPLKFYRAIRDWARRLLAPGGLLFLEINEELSEETEALFSDFSRHAIFSDCFGKPRFVVAEK